MRWRAEDYSLLCTPQRPLWPARASCGFPEGPTPMRYSHDPPNNVATACQQHTAHCHAPKLLCRQLFLSARIGVAMTSRTRARDTRGGLASDRLCGSHGWPFARRWHSHKCSKNDGKHHCPLLDWNNRQWNDALAFPELKDFKDSKSEPAFVSAWESSSEIPFSLECCFTRCLRRCRLAPISLCGHRWQ